MEPRSPRQRQALATRLTSWWKAENYNVMTEGQDVELHVCTTPGEAVARHIADLHNRTLGGGQDPTDWPAVARRHVAAQEGDREAIEDLAALAREAMNDPRLLRPDDQHTVTVEVKLDTKHIRTIVASQVARYARDGAVTWDVGVMVDRLRALGWGVLKPDDDRTLRDLAQDFAENVPGAHGAAAYLREGPEPYSLPNAVRRAYLAGFKDGYQGAGIPVMEIEGMPAEPLMVKALRGAGYEVTEPARPAPTEVEEGRWDCGVLHNGEGHTHPSREGAVACILEQAPPVVEVKADPGLSQVVEQP
jgi:hypothetical protein